MSAGGVRVSVRQSGARDEQAPKLEFYQDYFNVDTMDVVWRALYSLWPFKYTFVADARQNPDMYGPFWIVTTLVFMMAAAGNFAQYLGNSAVWHYDFYKVTYGAAVIYGYAAIIPLCFWDIKMGLAETLCIYGYSLFIFIFVAVLCILPIAWLQWVIVGVGALISTAFLVVNLWQPLREKMAYAVVVLIVLTALHLALALTFRLYFFQFTPAASTPSAPKVAPPAPQPGATPSFHI